MSRNDPAWAEHQRRWLRPDWQRWMRHDAHLFAGPDPNAYRSYAARLVARVRAEEKAVALAAERKAFEAELLEFRRQLVDIKFELARRRISHKYDPNQPRVPKGDPKGGQWAKEGGGDAGRTRSNDAEVVSDATPDNGWKPGARYAQFPPGTPGPPRRVFFAMPGMTYTQMYRLDVAMSRYQSTLSQIHGRGDLNWRPREQSASADPEGIDGLVGRMEARAREAEARLNQLTSTTGGNLGPRFDAPSLQFGRGALSPRTFDGSGWIDIYRTVHNAPDLFGHSTWKRDQDTVAVAQIDREVVFGVNSSAPGYTGRDERVADAWRSTMFNKYPTVPPRLNSGQFPYDALSHAEATLLLRAANGKPGALAGRTIDVQLDRDVCALSCERILPQLGLELGNPTLTFYNYKTGSRWMMRDGEWVFRRQK